jgi:4-amino-4-deoxy-L-arabinose transferase-like glycosyltransferase
MTRRQWFAFGIVVFVALLLRGLALYDLAAQGPDKLIEEDSITYEGPAKALLAHGRFAQDPNHPDIPMFKRTPGYPAFIAAAYAVFGENRVAVLVLQIVIASGTVAATYFLSRRIWGHSAGMATAAFVAIDSNQIYYSAVLLSEALFTFFVTLMCLGTVYCILERERQIRWATILGLALALATLVRPLSYYLLFFILIGFLLIRKTIFADWRKLVASFLLIIIPFAVMVGGWQLRNKEVVGSYTYTGMAGYQMLFYKAVPALMLAEDISEQEAHNKINARLPILSGLSPAAEMEARMKLGISIIFAHPIDYMRVAASGAVRFIAGPGESAILRMMGLDYREAGPLNDIRNQSLAVFAEKWITGNWPVLVVVTGALLFLLLQYVSAGIAVAHEISKPTVSPVIHLFLGCIFVYFLVLSSGIETYSRFRVPVAPVLMVYAGHGVILAGIWFGRRWRKVW